MMMGALHVVQVGNDDDVFFQGHDGEPLRRQIRYAELLKELRPGSRMTNVIITARSEARSFSIGNVEFCAVVAMTRGIRKAAGWMRVFAVLVRLHARFPIDLLTTQNVHDEAWPVLLFARLYSLPIIGQIHYDLFSSAAREDASRNRAVGRIRQAMTERFIPAFSALRVVGRRIAATLVERRLHKQVHILPVAVPLMTEPPGPRGMRTPKVLFVGRLCAQKNLEQWLHVCDQVSHDLPEVEFEIVGDGPLRGTLERQAAGLGIPVRFRGFVPNRDLRVLYESAQVFLLTSRYEGFGRVLVEAYAYGLPAVATRIAGVEDIIVSGSTGFLHELGDTDGMARSVIRLLREPSLAERMGQEGERLVRERFDPGRLASSWVGLLVDSARE